MTVKVIVIDMDGTFLDDAKKYDHARFMAQYQELKKTRHRICRRQRQSVLPTYFLFPRAERRNFLRRGKWRAGL